MTSHHEVYLQYVCRQVMSSSRSVCVCWGRAYNTDMHCRRENSWSRELPSLPIHHANRWTACESDHAGVLYGRVGGLHTEFTHGVCTYVFHVCGCVFKLLYLDCFCLQRSARSFKWSNVGWSADHMYTHTHGGRIKNLRFPFCPLPN